MYTYSKKFYKLNTRFHLSFKRGYPPSRRSWPPSQKFVTYLSLFSVPVHLHIHFPLRHFPFSFPRYSSLKPRFMQHNQPHQPLPPQLFCKSKPSPLFPLLRSLFIFSSHRFPFPVPSPLLPALLQIMYLHSLTPPAHSRELLDLSLSVLARPTSAQFCFSYLSY